MEAEHERVTHHKLKLLILECEIGHFKMHGIGRIRFVSVKTIEYRLTSRYADAGFHRFIFHRHAFAKAKRNV